MTQTDSPDSARTVFRLSGPDRLTFLQGLVTNDVARLQNGAIYTAMLTPQGKYLADFMLIPDGDTVLIDVASVLAPALQQRLMMYKLRSDIVLETTDASVTRGLGAAPSGAFRDPRHPDMGWRGYHGQPGDEDVNWTQLRVRLGIPASGVELTPDSFILEYGFEGLNGVDFRKGCYVGQEVTARMKHKTDLRKGLARVAIDGSAPLGTDILSGGKVAGTLYSQADGLALAYLRFDRVRDEMSAGTARVTVLHARTPQ